MHTRTKVMTSPCSDKVLLLDIHLPFEVTEHEDNYFLQHPFHPLCFYATPGGEDSNSCSELPSAEPHDTSLVRSPQV